MKKPLLLLAVGLLASCGEGPSLRVYATIELDDVSPALAAGRQLTAVDFVSATTGFVGDQKGQILATTDGGQTWAARTPPVSAAIRKLYFTSPTAGWAATASGFYRTADGGQSWQPVSVGSYTNSFADVQFVTPQVGYLLAVSDIFRTTNGGSSWYSIKPYNWYIRGELRALSFSAVDTGLVVGTDNFECQTTNGGSSWTFSGSVVSGGQPRAIIRRRNGSIVSVSSDEQTCFFDQPLGGSGYGQQPNPNPKAPMYALARWQNDIVGVGENAVVKRFPELAPNSTFTNWASLRGPHGRPLTGTFRSADFADAGTFYAVGDNGAIIRFHYY